MHCAIHNNLIEQFTFVRGSELSQTRERRFFEVAICGEMARPEGFEPPTP